MEKRRKKESRTRKKTILFKKMYVFLFYILKLLLFFLLAEKKKMELIAKYNELKKEGKLEKFIAKKIKKNSKKEFKYIPKQRRK